MIRKTRKHHRKNIRRRKFYIYFFTFFIIMAILCCTAKKMAAIASHLNFTDTIGQIRTLPEDSPANQDEESLNASVRPWYLTLVNQKNPLPDNYEINTKKVKGGEKVDARIYEPLTEMLNAAKIQGLEPVVVSGYRTTGEQKEIMTEKIDEFCRAGYSEDEARSLAEQWVALPGTSEHQLGLAVDINGGVYEIYSWLQENSYKYGFIFRYPADKEEITGISEEVWHYRYVGKDAAEEIYKRNLCLEEYLEEIEIS